MKERDCWAFMWYIVKENEIIPEGMWILKGEVVVAWKMWKWNGEERLVDHIHIHGAKAKQNHLAVSEWLRNKKEEKQCVSVSECVFVCGA